VRKLFFEFFQFEFSQLELLIFLFKLYLKQQHLLVYLSYLVRDLFEFSLKVLPELDLLLF